MFIEIQEICTIIQWLYTDTYVLNVLTLVVWLPGVPGSPRRTRRRLPGVPGSKKKKKIFFKMFNEKDSDMLVVIVGQYCSA